MDSLLRIKKAQDAIFSVICDCPGECCMYKPLYRSAAFSIGPCTNHSTEVQHIQSAYVQTTVQKCRIFNRHIYKPQYRSAAYIQSAYVQTTVQKCRIFNRHMYKPRHRSAPFSSGLCLNWLINKKIHKLRN